MMEGYLKSKFPRIESDDVIQDTLVALAKILPNYRYNAGETGSFHDYIIAVLRNKACDELRRIAKRGRLEKSVAEDPTLNVRSGDESQRLNKAILKIALQLVLEDDTILERNRRVFVETAINGIRPDKVAEMFGITRNNVDQIKARMIKSLQDKCQELEGAFDGFAQHSRNIKVS